MYNTRKTPTFSRFLTAKRENFKPQTEWTEGRFNRTLLIQLPGFKKEEIRMQLNNAGKLFIKGSRLAAGNKYIDVDQSFNVPKDVISDETVGKFEDECLKIIMPKSVITEAKSGAVAKEKTASNEATKEEGLKQEATKEEEPKQEEEEKHKHDEIDSEDRDENTSKEKTIGNEAMQNEQNQKEKSTITETMTSLVKETRITNAMHNEPTQEEKHKENSIDKEKKDENTSHEKTTSNEAMQNEQNQKEKSTITETVASLVKEAKSPITDEMHNEPTQEKAKESAGTDSTQNELNSEAKAEEMPKNNFDNNNIKDEDEENVKAKRDEGITHQEEKNVEQTIKEVKQDYKETVKAMSSEVKSKKEKMKEKAQNENEIYGDTPKEMRKEINNTKEGENGWWNSKYIDGAMSNRNIITVAAMALFGLFISHKLKARSS